jgi:WD40 repeat protein/transcriptional regulator with XRE-family HTH domain
MDSSAALETFRGLVLRHRGRTGLTQREFAERVGVHRRSLQEWEAGVTYPTPDRLQALIATLLDAGGLTVGRESSEVRDVWAAAEREAPRMHTPFDEEWFARLLSLRAGAVSSARTSERREDWGEAPDVRGFVGRIQELAQLYRCVVEERRRLVLVLGMGGIGKTSLAAKLVQDVAPQFDRIYWRSLRDALPPAEWLRGVIGFLSDRSLSLPDGEAAEIGVLLQLLRERPNLLVLDNFETILEPHQQDGRFRQGYATFGRLLAAIGETRHQSCLLLTSREAPADLPLLSGNAVWTVQLGGLEVDDSRALLADRQMTGTPEDWRDLVARFSGNSLALKVVGESIRELFGGAIAPFMQIEDAGISTVFAGIRRLLGEQIARSSQLEQRVLQLLAVQREPIDVLRLTSALMTVSLPGPVLGALEALRRRSLVERVEETGTPAFSLQSVVLEFVTDGVVSTAADEIRSGTPRLLVEQPLIVAQAKEYVRQTQERLIGEAILKELTVEIGAGATERQLLMLMNQWRDRPGEDQGYGPGNVLNLLRLVRGDLRGMDLSRLTLRQAYLADVEAQDASLAGADLAEAVMAQPITFPNFVALSGDGALLAAGNGAGEVWLWRVADRTPLLAVQAHAGPVYEVALSEDGRLLASAGEDGVVQLWLVPNLTEGDAAQDFRGRQPVTLRGHVGGVRSVALNADGRLLASGGVDRTVRLWDTRNGELLVTLQGHSGPVWSVALSASGDVLASGSWDGSARVWDAPGGRLLACFNGPSSPVYDVSLSGDGEILASGGEAGVRLWEVTTKRALPPPREPMSAVHGVALSRDGRLLASSASDALIRLWDVSSGQPLESLRGEARGDWGVAMSADGRLVASGSDQGTIRLWDVATRRVTSTLQGHTSGIRGVALSGDGALLAGGGPGGSVQLWAADTGQRLTTLSSQTARVWGVAMSADGTRLACGGDGGTIRIWEVPSGPLLATLDGHTTRVPGLALTLDGSLLASGGLDGTIRLWELPAGRARAALRAHSGGVRSVALSADGRVVASGGWDGTTRLWDGSTGHPLATFQGHDTVWSVALTPDGSLMASGYTDGTVRVWDTLSKQLVAALQGHTGPACAVTLSGQLLASGGFDHTVRLWRASSGQLLATLEGHTGPVMAVALSADEQLLASGSFDGTLRLWDTRSGVCLRSMRTDRRYERLDITGARGVTDAQRAALLALGAVERKS